MQEDRLLDPASISGRQFDPHGFPDNFAATPDPLVFQQTHAMSKRERAPISGEVTGGRDSDSDSEDRERVNASIRDSMKRYKAEKLRGARGIAGAEATADLVTTPVSSAQCQAAALTPIAGATPGSASHFGGGAGVGDGEDFGFAYGETALAVTTPGCRKANKDARAGKYQTPVAQRGKTAGSSVVASTSTSRPTRGKSKKWTTVPLTKFKATCYEVIRNNQGKSKQFLPLMNRYKKKNKDAYGEAWGISIPDKTAFFIQKITESYMHEQYKKGTEMVDRVKAGCKLADTISGGGQSSLMTAMLSLEDHAPKQKGKAGSSKSKQAVLPLVNEEGDESKSDSEAESDEEDPKKQAKRAIEDQSDDEFYEKEVKNSSLLENHVAIISEYVATITGDEMKKGPDVDIDM